MSFAVGGRVRIRDVGRFWKLGVVVALSPDGTPLVKEDGQSQDSYACEWDECMPLVDYNKEAIKLFASLNLNETGVSEDYLDLNPVYQHTNGSRLYVGNAMASQSKEILEQHAITCIVNCTDDLPNVFEDGSVTYFDFDIYRFMEFDLEEEEEEEELLRGILKFFEDVFRFVEQSLESGKNVLVHCLAGAHRAGTTGIACVMHLAQLDAVTSTKGCQACRSAVEPFGDLGILLKHLGNAQALGLSPAKLQVLTMCDAENVIVWKLPDT